MLVASKTSGAAYATAKVCDSGFEERFVDFVAPQELLQFARDPLSVSHQVLKISSSTTTTTTKTKTRRKM
jgi:hypothetical protein